jgi:signal transduction histidine kinase
MGERDKKDSLRPDFARITSMLIDVHGLMSHFFNILSLSADVDAGAYFVNYRSHMQFRLFRRPGLEMYRFEKFKKDLLGKASSCCPGLTQDMFETVEVSSLELVGGTPANAAGAGYYKELPLFHRDEPSGMILLCSYGKNNPFTGSAIMTEMTLFINRALEGVFDHSFEEEKIFADIILNFDHGIYLAARDGILTAVNPKGSEILPGLCGRNMDCVTKNGDGRLLGPGCACGFSDILGKARDRDARSGKKVHSGEVVDGTGRTFLLTVSSIATSSRYSHVITARDITEEKLIQNRALLSGKLASLGEMVSGIAHEINNPLQAILLNIELLEATFRENDGSERLARIKESVLRIKRFVKELIIFAKEHGTRTEDTDINVLIGKTVEMLRNHLQIANVNVLLDLDKSPLIVKCNKNLFQQVIVNLLQNARDAIEESGKGSTIQIRSGLLPGKAFIEISDDGPGISEEIRTRVFDPFFTTKDIEKGTGLGLNISRKVLENMGGTITVSASTPNGASFRITLPHQA